MSPNPLLRYRNYEKELACTNTDDETRCGCVILKTGSIPPTSLSTFTSTTQILNLHSSLVPSAIFTPQPQPQPQTQKSTSIKIKTKNAPIPNPRLSTGTIAGIAIGIVVGVILLAGVAYVYYLRARELKRTRMRRRKKKRRKGEKSAGGGGAPPAPPPPPGGAFPPANP